MPFRYGKDYILKNINGEKGFKAINQDRFIVYYMVFFFLRTPKATAGTGSCDYESNSSNAAATASASAAAAAFTLVLSAHSSIILNIVSSTSDFS